MIISGNMGRSCVFGNGSKGLGSNGQLFGKCQNEPGLFGLTRDT